MKSRYSIFSLARNAMNYHKDWERAWRSPNPKHEYDAVIVGAGGHGLATAYYLAKYHGVTNVAVLEKSYLGGGNTARTTRSRASPCRPKEPSSRASMSARVVSTRSPTPSSIAATTAVSSGSSSTTQRS
jgi:thioredoxin reductase